MNLNWKFPRYRPTPAHLGTYSVLKLLQHLLFIPDRLAAKLARKDSLAFKLAQRPQRQELIERNILHMVMHISVFGITVF